MIQVNIMEAETNFLSLISSLEDNTNDSVVVARNGKPIAKIIPIKSEQHRKSFLDAGAGQYILPPANVLESLDDELLSEFERDAL